MPQSEEEVLNYLDMASLENQPTEVLVQLADKLKDRRNKLYPQDMQASENSYEPAVFAHKNEPASLFEK